MSFENDSVIDIEPENNDWDIVFTQYTHIFESTDPPSYLVTGVMTNYLQNITVAKDTSYFFEDISYDNLNEFDFSNNQDQIGYNWKEYSLSTASYVVNTAINYIIKNRDNKYFKLRFIGFYNAKNIVHIVLDNFSYESTGSQNSISKNIDLCNIAKSSGYKFVKELVDFDINNVSFDKDELSFYRIHVGIESNEEISRVTHSPEEITKNFKLQL